MIKAIAIDDEPMPLNILLRYSQETDQIELAKTFTSTLAARNFLTENKIDLLFLDINMPAQSGLDFFKSLSDSYMVIFTTAHAEYAVDGFNLNAVDYLLKPYSLERFKQAINKAVEFHKFRKGNNTNEIFVKADYGITKIPIEEIVLIEAYTDYLKIHRTDKKMVITRMTMNNIAKLLPNNFIRVHRSYLIPMSKVAQWSSREIILGEHKIPIGKTYHKEVQELLKKNIL
jgi:DNA-binding LytR/AlgR family response regulator